MLREGNKASRSFRSEGNGILQLSFLEAEHVDYGLSPNVSEGSKDEPVPKGWRAGISVLSSSVKILSNRPLTSFFRNREETVSLYDVCQLERAMNHSKVTFYI